MLGNTVLVDYGIQTEKSDLRAHVCALAEKVYVYRTTDGLSALESGGYALRPVYTDGIQTAMGCAVPVERIPNVCSVAIPKPWLAKVAFADDDPPSVKGEKAVKIVKGLLKTGRFPMLPLTIAEIEDRQLQIDGADIYVSLGVKIQVKCDYKGGTPDPAPGAVMFNALKYICTGNLFLQTAECNPFRYR